MILEEGIALFSATKLRIKLFFFSCCKLSPILNYWTICLRPTEVPRNIEELAIWVLDFWF